MRCFIKLPRDWKGEGEEIGGVVVTDTAAQGYLVAYVGLDGEWHGVMDHVDLTPERARAAILHVRAAPSYQALTPQERHFVMFVLAEYASR